MAFFLTAVIIRTYLKANKTLSPFHFYALEAIRLSLQFKQNENSKDESKQKKNILTKTECLHCKGWTWHDNVQKMNISRKKPTERVWPVINPSNNSRTMSRRSSFPNVRPSVRHAIPVPRPHCIRLSMSSVILKRISTPSLCSVEDEAMVISFLFLFLFFVFLIFDGRCSHSASIVQQRHDQYIRPFFSPIFIRLSSWGSFNETRNSFQNRPNGRSTFIRVSCNSFKLWETGRWSTVISLFWCTHSSGLNGRKGEFS